MLCIGTHANTHTHTHTHTHTRTHTHTHRSYEAERIGVDFITHNSIGEGGGEVLGSDLVKLEESIAKLTQMLDKTIEYVDDVDAVRVVCV